MLLCQIDHMLILDHKLFFIQQLKKYCSPTHKKNKAHIFACLDQWQYNHMKNIPTKQINQETCDVILKG